MLTAYAMVATVELLLDNKHTTYGFTCVAPVASQAHYEHSVCVGKNIAGPVLTHSASHRSSPSWILTPLYVVLCYNALSLLAHHHPILTCSLLRPPLVVTLSLSLVSHSLCLSPPFPPLESLYKGYYYITCANNLCGGGSRRSLAHRRPC